MRKFHLLVDFDTPLVSAAAVQQQNTIIVEHTPTKKTKEFQNRTTFKTWLKENPKWNVEEFLIKDNRTIVGSARKAVDGLLTQMGSIYESSQVESVKFCLGGPHGNFRDKVARIQPYKGKRPDKPLLFDSIKKLLIKEVGQHIIQPDCDIETDDVASIYLAEHKHLGEKSDRAISSPDKDLKMCVGWHIDPDNIESPATYTDELKGFYHLCYQALLGDSTDNIPGIPSAVESVQKRFGLRKSSGFGPKSAEGCLAGADSIEALVERVSFVYYETFKDGLTLDCGTKLSWIEVMDENVQLLKMLDFKGQVYKFSEEFGIKH